MHTMFEYGSILISPDNVAILYSSTYDFSQTASNTSANTYMKFSVAVRLHDEYCEAARKGIAKKLNTPFNRSVTQFRKGSYNCDKQ